MKYIKSEKYNKDFIKENIMGPNPIKLLEELLNENPLVTGETVLDLGCGKGVTSIFAAKEYKARVFATDLWITPTENKKRFDEAGLSSQQIIPIKAEAHDLPYADEFFDTVICTDSYHYFGFDKEYLNSFLLPKLKHGGRLLIVVPGFINEIHDNLPPELLLSWTPEDLETMQCIDAWKKVFDGNNELASVEVKEMESFDECWQDWLECGNDYAVGDRKSMNAGAGKYMNFISIVIYKK